ncbi:hypothetical protein [Dokdonella sp.]|uniref:hypothetical protein n=1 Tax=Dokdonella sp. TaxID=2291710 RepID=UPI002F3F9420
MQAATVYAKTDAGRAEIGSRRHKLAPPVRSLLLLVDGQRDAAQLRRFGETLHAPAGAIDQLATLGLIAPLGSAAAAPEPAATAPSPAAQRFITLSGLMSEGVREYLGLRGFMTQLRIERCSNADELLALLPDISAAIAKARSAEFAHEWERIVRAAVA